jgi:hypothetical protein
MANQNAWVVIIGVIAGSSLLAAFATNWQGARQQRKEVVAGATKSALKRVEMYYRLKRRLPSGEDNVAIRDALHDVQEENDYYCALLSIEAPWLGMSYRNFLTAIKRELEPFMHEAWLEKSKGPSVQITKKERPNIGLYVDIFTTDSKRLFNPIMRPLMRIRYSLRKLFKENPYGL